MFVVFPNHATNYRKLTEKTVVAEEAIDYKVVWDVTFEPKLGKTFKRKFKQLTDWSKSTDPKIKYFSGTAKYETTFHSQFSIDSSRMSFLNFRFILDLGELEDIAEVEINGEKVGVLWAPPYKIDVTR